MRRRIGFGIGLGVALLACVAFAAGPGGVRKRAESSTLVIGSIDIEQDGRVGAHRIDEPEKFPVEVVQLIDKVATQWQFEPVKVDGRAVRARAKMSVRVVIKRQDDQSYQLRIASASFGEDKAVEGESITSTRMGPPRYPTSAYMSGVQGTVYLVLKINPEGKVEGVVDEQVNLMVVGSDPQMAQARKALAKAATVAARNWRFVVPVRGELAGKEFWSLRVPVDFRLCDDRSECEASGKPVYGSWNSYIPGPKNPVPWLSEEENKQAPDALVAGGVYPVGTGPRLLTPLTES